MTRIVQWWRECRLVWRLKRVDVSGADGYDWRGKGWERCTLCREWIPAQWLRVCCTTFGSLVCHDCGWAAHPMYRTAIEGHHYVPPLERI